MNIDKDTAKTTIHNPMTEEQIRTVNVGGVTPLTEPIHIADYDPDWPKHFEHEARRIRTALGESVILLEHVGSTSVPGLAAKPRIDMVLVVADSADEAAYLPALQAIAYTLQVREPEWYEHRLLRGPERDINLHVFSTGCTEVERMILFRDYLRTHPTERNLYEHTKHELAGKKWTYVQNYADAKSEVVEGILLRAREESVHEDAHLPGSSGSPQDAQQDRLKHTQAPDRPV